MSKTYRFEEMKAELKKAEPFAGLSEITLDLSDILGKGKATVYQIVRQDPLRYFIETDESKKKPSILLEAVNFSGVMKYPVIGKDLIFAKPVGVKTVIYKEDVSLTNCLFLEDVTLLNTEFRHSASFNGSVFIGNLNTSLLDFKKYISFRNARFHRNVDITTMTFHGDVSFQKSIFMRETRFEKAEFFSNADFADIEFNGRVFFNLSKFLGDVVAFDHSVFNGVFRFENSIVENFYNMRGITVGKEGSLAIVNVIFKGSSHIDFLEFEKKPKCEGVFELTDNVFRGLCRIPFRQLQLLGFKPLLLLNPWGKTDYAKTKDNFRNLVQIYRLSGEVSYALDLDYYYNKYSRLEKHRWVMQDPLWKNLYHLVIRGLEWFFVDLSSRYFTDWVRVVISVVVVLFFFRGLYALSADLMRLDDHILPNLQDISARIAYSFNYSVINFIPFLTSHIKPTGILLYYTYLEGGAGLYLLVSLILSVFRRVIG